jgi:hypothetical protein
VHAGFADFSADVFGAGFRKDWVIFVLVGFEQPLDRIELARTSMVEFLFPG